MSAEQKASSKPKPCLQLLQKRAQWCKTIRSFFEQKQVLEVDTPLLGQYSVSEAGLIPFMTDCQHYLQTSPEYAMKRLLADGSGSIYQLCKAFRYGEQGRCHNPEFLLLEWYRVDWCYRQLLSEIESLLTTLIHSKTLHIIPYADCFIQATGIDPHQTTLDELQLAGKRLLSLEDSSLSITDWLELLFDTCSKQYQSSEDPVAFIEYPQVLAQLAEVGSSREANRTHPVAYRFEIYWRGYELANGYQELTCPKTLQARWQQQLAQPCPRPDWPERQDPRLLQAMEQGLPACSGVALGIDRLMMVESQAAHIREILPFNFDNC